ncbi:DUF6603 domain-containing protein [Taibaiella koreensis]|uniref:DUF6603 domain-containing protein n=1 Tax=Taibaiella koreensis TaxID=1268548 RepID=UPI000E59FA45|nr:DUF6603 domain-containing protein [Taibaiella koreensis]
MPTTTTIGPNAINPIAMQIGTLIGLFIKDKDSYALNTEWFKNPWSYISAIPSKPELFELLTTLMGSAGGDALGAPREAMNRIWYPILNPITQGNELPKPTGVYIVTSKPVDGLPTELGLGALYDWEYESFSILPFAYFPMISLPATAGGSFQFILGQDKHPVETGINITGADGVFNTGGGDASLSFDGFLAASKIYFAAGQYPSLDLCFLNLKLPGEKQGSNRSLFDLIQNASVQQSITVALSVLGSQLCQLEGVAQTAGKMVHSLMELLGLLGPVPGIDWDALVKDPSKVVAIFTQWLQNISSDQAILRSWLNDWYCLFKGLDATDDKNYVTGTGTRIDPLTANLLTFDFGQNLSVLFNLSFATVKTEDGTLELYPGFSISTSPITPVSSVPEFGVQVLAAAEVLCYHIPGKGKANTISFFPRYSIMASAANIVAGKPLFAVADAVGDGAADEANPAGFSIGRMEVGFTYDSLVAESKVPTPNFRLVEVQTAIGAWPLVDLSNFNVETLQQAIGPVVSSAIKTFFGENNAYAEAMTAVLGIDPPKDYPGEWPLKDKMLLSPQELPLLIKNPFAALGAYYSRCLSTDDTEGNPLFQHLVSAFSILLGSDNTTVTGDGTELHPWRIPMFTIGTATINLDIWKPGDELLGIAFDFTIPLPIDAVAATFSLNAAMMVLQLPGNDGAGTWNAAWMQALTGRLQIKDAKEERLQTPQIGGVAIAAADVYVEGGWKNTESFFVKAGIDSVELISSATTIDLGNIEIGTAGWSVDQLKQFAPAIVNGLGLLLLENGGTVGVCLTIALGLLPNLPEVFDGYKHEGYNFPVPEYLVLPEGWPVLEIKHFDNPWTDIVTQLSNLYANEEFMISLMQVIGWGITGITPGAPDIQPVGTMTDPWIVNLPNVFDIDLLTWKEGNQTGIGAQKQFAINAAEGVQIATIVRIDVPGVKLDGFTGPVDTYPGIALVTNIQNPDVTLPLVNINDELIINKVQLGAFLQLQNGELKLIPVFRFQGARLRKDEVFRDIELIPVDGKPQFTSSDTMAVFNTLLNAMMNELSAAVQQPGFVQLQSLLDILGLLGVLDVAIDSKTKLKEYSFNPGAWASILANPGGYFMARVQAVLNSDQLCAALIQSLAQLMGYNNFDLPLSWQGVQFLLQSLMLAKDYNGQFVPVFDNWLALFKDPVTYLQQNVAALFNSPALIQQLVTSVSKLLTLPAAGLEKYFSVDTSGKILTVQIPTDKIFKIGDELRLYASVVIDVNSYTLTNSIALGSRTLDSAVTFLYAPSFKEGKLSHDYGIYLTGIPGMPQAFAPLPLWPFPADTAQYLKQIGFQVPVTLLSSFAVKYLNEYIVPVNPAVNNIFQVLGLTTEVEGAKQIVPLTGIFMNPADWLLGPDVLGDGQGNVDLTRLGNLLYAITDAAGIKVGDVTLKAYSHDGKNDGVELTGLPWGVTFTLFANREEGANLKGSFKPPLPAAAPNITLGAGVAFGTANGVNVDGVIDMSYDLGDNNTLGITAAYAKRKFTLNARANTSEFLLLPFGGLNQFLNEGTAGVLLTIIGDKLFSTYDAYAKKNPGSALIPFVQSIETLTGIKSGTDLFNFFNTIYQDPLGQFTEANITQALSNINDFVTGILTLQGFSLSASKQILQYEHTFGIAKVLIDIGIRDIEGTKVFGLWLNPVASFSWMSLGLNQTGVGIALPFDYKQPDLRYEVNIALGTDFSAFKIPNAPQPTLLFGLKGTLQGMQGPILECYPVKVSDADGTLKIALLPTPALLITGRANVTLAQWMINFGTEFLIPFAANTALGVSAVKNWLDKTKIGTIEGAPGLVLTDWGLLVKQDGNYYLANLREAFNINDPVSIVTKLIFSALNLLDGQCVVPIKDHGIYVQSSTEGDLKRYGLRIQITDIEVTSALNSDGAKLLFQIGKYYGDQTKDDNWTGLKSDPGFVAYFINRNSKTSALSFQPKFDLISVGLDFAGANAQSPLINTKGVTIQSIEPRAYVSLDFNGTLRTDFGAGMMLYSLGVPLGPGFGNQGGNSNPVAQNLLTSGGNPGKTDAINPSFSISASYVYNAGSFDLQLYDANGLQTDKIWISIMRAFGPLQCRKVGIGWKGDKEPKRLDFLFDGQVSLAGLMANLVELDIGIPITDPTNYGAYSLDLAGLDVSYNAGAVTIGGGFLKDDSAGYIQYTGQAMIQTASFGIGAFGSYALIDGHPSLFIFAYLNAPLGGPPCFFIKGLSGGFGYNRTINIPPANQIENFPFVAGIQKPAALGGVDGKAPTNEQALKALGTKIVPPQLGSYWVAAGIMFSSFELIDSKAVLMVIFGNDFEIALLGLSGLLLPKTGRTYVGAQIAFKVTYKVSTGLLAMEAVLTSNSYVIDPNCRLTGGLAFYVWFKDQPDTGARAGDFVFTLGGYHPAFKKPAYYPDVPRLGFSWAVGGNVSIKGGAYFALTPSAVMAGGSLEAVYQSGNLKAWFTAYADFLIMWNPFYYDIRVGVSVGASYTVHFIWTTTFKVELGADVHIWGPPMAGSVTVHWWVISFTVNFGATDTKPNDTRIIDWNEFQPYFLPSDKAPATAPQQEPEPEPEKTTKQLKRDAAGVQTVPVQQVTNIKQVTGLIKEIPNPDTKVNTVSPVLWRVGADGFSFTVSTVVPLNEISITGVQQKISSNVKFGIRPMGNVVFGTKDAMSTLSLSFKYYDAPYDKLDNWNISGDTNGIPESLWGTKNNGKTEISAEIIPGALVGLSARIASASDDLPQDGPPMFPLSNLGYAAWAWRKLTLANNPWLHPTQPAVASDQSLIIIEDTVMAPAIATVRTAILEAVVGAGINVGTDGRLDQMAAYASDTFQSYPMLGELGSLGYQQAPPQRMLQAKTLSRSVAPAAFKAKIRSAAEPVKIRAVMTQYSRPDLPSPVFMAASPDEVKMIHPVKGKMYSADKLPQGQAAAMVQGRNLEAAAGGKPGLELFPGVAALLDLDPLAAAPYLDISGDTPVFAAWFDEDYQLIGSRVLTGSIALPQGVAELYVAGISTASLEMPYAFGWHVTAQLTLVNPNALTGIGAIVVPDSPIRVKYLRSSSGFGLLSGQTFVNDNLVKIGEQSVPAGIKTVLPGQVNTLAVLSKKRSKNTPLDPASIKARIKIDTGDGPAYQDLTPVQVVDGAYEAAVLYTLPGNTGYDARIIYTTSDADTWISGVMGLAEEVTYVAENWQKVVLQPALPYPYPEAGSGTHISIGPQ